MLGVVPIEESLAMSTRILDRAEPVGEVGPETVPEIVGINRAVPGETVVLHERRPMVDSQQIEGMGDLHLRERRRRRRCADRLSR